MHADIIDWNKRVSLFSKNLVSILETIVENSRTEFFKRKKQKEGHSQKREQESQKIYKTYHYVSNSVSEEVPTFEISQNNMGSTFNRFLEILQI